MGDPTNWHAAWHALNHKDRDLGHAARELERLMRQKDSKTAFTPKDLFDLLGRACVLTVWRVVPLRDEPEDDWSPGTDWQRILVAFLVERSVHPSSNDLADVSVLCDESAASDQRTTAITLCTGFACAGSSKNWQPERWRNKVTRLRFISAEDLFPEPLKTQLQEANWTVSLDP